MAKTRSPTVYTTYHCINYYVDVFYIRRKILFVTTYTYTLYNIQSTKLWYPPRPQLLDSLSQVRCESRTNQSWGSFRIIIAKWYFWSIISYPCCLTITLSIASVNIVASNFNIKVIDVIIIVDVTVNVIVIVIVIDVIIIFDVIANVWLSSPGEDSCARSNFPPQRFPSFQQRRKLSDPGLEVISTTDSCRMWYHNYHSDQHLKIIVIIVVIITSNYVELSIKMRENTKGSTVIQRSLRNPSRVFATKK